MPSQEGVLTRSFGTNRLRSLEPLLVRTLATRALDPPIERPCPCGAPLRIIASEGPFPPRSGCDRWRLGLQGTGDQSFGSAGLLTLGRESPE